MSDLRPQSSRPGPYPTLPEEPSFEESGYDRGYSLQKPEPAALYLDLLRRRWGWVVLCVIVSLAVTAAYVDRQIPIYSTSALMLVEPSSSGSSQSATADIIDQMAGGSSSETRSLQTQVEISRQSLIQEQAIRSLRLPKVDTRHLAVTVSQVGDTNLITVAVNYPAPQVARRLANAIPALYLEETRTTNQSQVSAARQFVQVQLVRKREQLAQKEKELEDTKERLHSPDIAAQSSQLATASTTFDTELRNADVERAAAVAQLGIVSRQLPREEQPIVSSTSVALNPLVSQFESQLVTLELQRASLLKILQPNQPEIVSLDNQIRDLQSRLKAGIKNTIVAGKSIAPNPIRQGLIEQAAGLQGTIKSQEARKVALTGAVASLSHEINQLPMKERMLNSLQREVLVVSDFYNSLNQKYQELRLDEAAKLANGRLLKPATLPVSPIYPEKRKMFGTALIIGLSLGLLLVMGLEALDNTLRDPGQIETGLGLSVLAGIPYMKGFSSVFKGAKEVTGSEADRSSSGYSSTSPLSGAAQSLQAAVTFNNPDSPIRSLLIVSPLPGEGKTTISRQFAKVAAESGQRVVLVDMDFRRPGLTREYDLRQAQGISNLVMQQAALESVLAPTEIEGLFVVPTGPLPSNPVAFIQSERFNWALGAIRDHCDLVVIDAPPLIMTDALYLARKVDGVILVVVPGTTTKGAIDRAVELLRRAKANIIGVCLNKVTRTNVSNYYGQYGYGYYGYYNYGYGYGDRERGEAQPSSRKKAIQLQRPGSNGSSSGPAPHDGSDEA